MYKRTIGLIVTVGLLIAVATSCSKPTSIEIYDSAVRKLTEADSLSMTVIYNTIVGFDDPEKENQTETLSSHIQYQLVEPGGSLEKENVRVRAFMNTGLNENTINAAFYYVGKDIYFETFPEEILYKIGEGTDLFIRLPYENGFFLADDMLIQDLSEEQYTLSENIIFVNGEGIDATCYEIKATPGQITQMGTFFDVVAESIKATVADSAALVDTDNFVYKVYMDNDKIVFVEISYETTIPDPENAGENISAKVFSTIEINSVNDNSLNFPDVTGAEEFKTND